MTAINPTITALLLAGGNGTRFKSSTPKVFHPLGPKLVAKHSFDFFKGIPWIDDIVVVSKEKYHFHFEGARFAPPGERRQDSVYNGIQNISSDFVLIHDAARPFIHLDDLENLRRDAFKYRAAALASRSKNTIKKGDALGIVTKTLDRDHLFEIYTPQLISKDLLLKGFSKAKEQNLTVTDDLSLVELLGRNVKLTLSLNINIKITTPQDLHLVEFLLCPAIN